MTKSKHVTYIDDPAVCCLVELVEQSDIPGVHHQCQECGQTWLCGKDDDQVSPEHERMVWGRYED